MERGNDSKTLLEENAERMSGEDVSVLRDRPFSEMHERIRQGNGGRMPLCFGFYGNPSYIPNPEGNYKKAIKTPWHERVRRLYHQIFR